MKRSQTDPIIAKKKNLDAKKIMRQLYDHTDEIPEKVIHVFPVQDYLIVDDENLQKKLMLMIDEYHREKEKKQRLNGEREKKLISKLLNGFLPDRIFKIVKFKFKETGGIKDDTQSHYYYGSRLRLEEEFETYYEMSIELEIDVENDNYQRSLHFSVSMEQDEDVGDDKVYFETNVNFEFTECFSCDENDNEENLLISRRDVRKLIKMICENFVKSKLVFEKIKEKF